MYLVPLIERKRDGGRLTPAEWQEVVAGYAAHLVPDYQMAALLMAIVLRGVDADELFALTEAMLRSGASLEWGSDAPPRVDKHSTGGVGDKVTLVLAPLLASAGALVPAMAGRALGHTGGTVDKLEAIPGFRTVLSVREVREQVERIGCAIFAQSPEIAPADRKLYALRDATGTVASVPLIAASIMSKKLAEGLSGLVLDVKHGEGAFLPERADAIRLARTMIELGRRHGCPTVAVLTAMDRPLGHACGNALEVREAIAALKGEGPPDLMEIVWALGTEMALLAGLARERPAARRLLQRAVSDGAAFERWRCLVEAQGGDPRVVDDPDLLPRAPVARVWRAARSGFVAAVHARSIGRIVVELGGGRRRMDEPIDPGVGVVLRVKPGDRVERGDELAVVHARRSDDAAMAEDRLVEAITIDDAPPPPSLELIGGLVA